MNEKNEQLNVPYVQQTDGGKKTKNKILQTETKLLAKSWFMKQNYKIQHGLEDPKQLTIHLALALQLKQDWG